MKLHLPGRWLVGEFICWRVQGKAQRIAFLARRSVMKRDGFVEPRVHFHNRIAFLARRSVMKMDTWLDEAVSFSGKSFL